MHLLSGSETASMVSSRALILIPVNCMRRALPNALETLKKAGGEVIQFSDDENQENARQVHRRGLASSCRKIERNAKGVELWKQFLKDKGNCKNSCV